MKPISSDPDFQALPEADKHAVLWHSDPEYAALPPDQQKAVLSALASQTLAQPVDMNAGLNGVASGINKTMQFINNPGGQDMRGVNTMELQGPEMFNKMGGATAEYLGKKGVNPYVAAGAGTLVSMANPQNWITPVPEARTPLPGQEALQNAAQEAGVKTLGFTKRFLNKPGAFDRAKDVSQTMLDTGVITNPITHPLSSGSADMLERAQTVGDTAGQQIGEGLKALDDAGIPSLDAKAVASKVHRALKPAYSGGAYDAESKIADEIRATILAHGDGPLTFQSAQALKEKLQEIGKFEQMSNGLKAQLYRKASTTVKQAMEDAIGAASAPSSETGLALPKDSQTLVPDSLGMRGSPANPIIDPTTLENYMKAKKVYGASEQAEKALTNRFSSEQGNKNIGLTDTIAAGAELAAGNPGRALALVGAKKALERYYHATKATAADYLAKTSIGPAVKKAAYASFISKLTTRENSQ